MTHDISLFFECRKCMTFRFIPHSIFKLTLMYVNNVFSINITTDPLQDVLGENCRQNIKLNNKL